MNSKKLNPENFRKILLNRLSVTQAVIDCIEHCLSFDDDAAKHFFHKIMVHNWSGNDEELFNTLSDHFNTTFVPLNHHTYQGHITTFYTNSIALVSKIINFDFMFPYQRNMFNVDVLYNDKTSEECLGSKETLDDLIRRVVAKRLSESFELDLSNFCADGEFEKYKIFFYKINLLSQFKVLMLRMGKDTKTLNLSYNNLSQAPMDIINFFIKGDLVAINLSHNNIPSLSELMRVSSKIEKLWIEGNPLCDEMDPATYVKQVLVKFPRLTELDGVKVNQYGIHLPFFKNYLSSPDKKTKMLVEKFLSLYFSHYDDSRSKIDMFYEAAATFSLSVDFIGTAPKDLSMYAVHSRNATRCTATNSFAVFHAKVCRLRQGISAIHKTFPETEHDPTSFTVDVVDYGKTIIVIVDGIFRHKTSKDPNQMFRFRRTFVLNNYIVNTMTVYHIVNEMFYISFATKEQKEPCFKAPVRNLNSLALIDPDESEVQAVTKIFSHLTQLKKDEVKRRLEIHNWDIRKALNAFLEDMKTMSIKDEQFMKHQEDTSDLSSVSDDDMDWK